MTINHVRMAFEESISSNQKFIFIVLCDMANNENACWPGTWLISKRTSIPEDIVLRELENLKNNGFIDIKQNTYFMGKSRKYLFFVYPSKSNKSQEKQIISYSSDVSRSPSLEYSKNRTTKDSPMLASEIARIQIAEIKKKLGSTLGDKNERY